MSQGHLAEGTLLVWLEVISLCCYMPPLRKLTKIEPQ